MNFIELQILLQNLTNSKVSLSKIAEILNVTPANISKRAKNNSEITVSELAVVEQFYNKCFYKSPVNSLDRQFDEKILPDLTILDNLKQNFKISIDWLLYGE